MLQSDQSEPVISKIGFTPRLKTDVEHLQAGLGELLPVCHGENIWNGNILLGDRVFIGQIPRSGKGFPQKTPSWKACAVKPGSKGEF